MVLHIPGCLSNYLMGCHLGDALAMLHYQQVDPGRRVQPRGERKICA